ncbi:MAG: hypothetical protein ACKO8Z_01705 [Prosthecobacter sp.]
MKRIVAPEILETLAADDPQAVQGRLDLLKVNWIMGNHRWLLRTLRRERKAGERICELGAGDGTLSRKILHGAICVPQELHSIDLANEPSGWPPGAVWHSGDLFDRVLPDGEILIANLFLHHFTAEQLALLGLRISPKTRLIIAAEPARYFIHQFMGWLFSKIARLNPVTCHDMQVSLRAGFRRDELSRALGLGDEWTITCQSRPFGALRMVMRR